MPIKLRLSSQVPDLRKLSADFRLPKLPRPKLGERAQVLRSPEAPRHPILAAVTKPLRMVNWRIVTMALFGVGILHIIATLAAPSLAIATAFNRLEGVLPLNRVAVLPKISPEAQPLPFLSPALRVAMCRFDTRVALIDIEVELSEAGSSLTIYSPEGEAIYTAAQGDVAQHRVRIIPADGRFLGLTAEAHGKHNNEIASATLAADRGIAVYAVPARGHSYEADTQRQLASATCRPAAN